MRPPSLGLRAQRCARLGGDERLEAGGAWAEAPAKQRLRGGRRPAAGGGPAPPAPSLEASARRRRSGRATDRSGAAAAEGITAAKVGATAARMSSRTGAPGTGWRGRPGTFGTTASPPASSSHDQCQFQPGTAVAAPARGAPPKQADVHVQSHESGRSPPQRARPALTVRPDAARSAGPARRRLSRRRC